MTTHTNETPAERGLEEIAGRRVPITKNTVGELVAGVLEQRTTAASLPPVLYALWSDGYAAAAHRFARDLQQANHDADYWWARNRFGESEIADMRSRAIAAGFESGANRWLDPADMTLSWSERQAVTA